MKIVSLITQYPPHVDAGIGRYAQVMMPRLAAHADVTVLTLNRGGAATHEKVDGLTVVRPPSLTLRLARRLLHINRGTRFGFAVLTLAVLESNLRYLPRLARLRRRGELDLVSAHDSTNFIATLFAEHILRVPVVLHIHTTEYGLAPIRSIADPLRLFERLERHLARHAALVVTTSPETAHLLREHGWGDDRHVRYVLHGSGFTGQTPQPVGVTERERLRARLSIEPSSPVLLFVGRLAPQKGVVPLVQAMRTVCDRVPQARLILAGEGNDREVMDLVNRLGLSDRVILAGFVTQDELPAYYCLADLCVFPSVFEPFGLVAVEAMALGQPCALGSGFSEVFFRPHDQGPATAIRIDESDPPAMGAVLASWLTCPEKARSLGEAGRMWANQRFSWQRATDETLTLYTEALRRSGHRRNLSPDAS